MAFLIDTDILIYSLKGVEPVMDRFRMERLSPISISVISYGELIYGAANSAFPEKNRAKVLKIRSIYPIIPVDEIIMETFGDLKASLRQAGTTLADMDLLIGATALAGDFTLVTNNIKHFSKIPGLKLDNWMNG